jgi:hypothetical protein
MASTLRCGCSDRIDSALAGDSNDQTMVGDNGFTMVLVMSTACGPG